MKLEFTAVFDTPIGKIRANFLDNALVRISFLPVDIREHRACFPVEKLLIEQITQYFVNANVVFTVPIALNGTPLQVKVWEALRAIPVGATVTYGQLAHRFATNPRVIGNICKHNPIPIIVPCHRVVAAHSFGGYCGQRVGDFVDIKAKLLRHEGI